MPYRMARPVTMALDTEKGYQKSNDPTRELLVTDLARGHRKYREEV